MERTVGPAMDDFLDTINPNTFIGARTYAMELLLLDTGIRASELCRLTLVHTDLEGGEIKVLGKDKKERFVHFGVGTKRALVRFINTFGPEAMPVSFSSCSINAALLSTAWE